MKKCWLLFIAILLLVGCERMMNTPTGKVADFLSKYQNLEKNVKKELTNVLEQEQELNKKQKEGYRLLLEKQYHNLAYKITEEKIEKNHATVTAEIEVLDFATTIRNSRKKYQEQIEEEKESSYIDYQIKELKKVEDKVKHEIVFILKKKDGIWNLTELSKEDYQKINGFYE